MEISRLKDLLELLKEYGVVEYANEGLTLKLGGSISVHKHKTEKAEATEGRSEPRKIDQRLLDAWQKLPEAYHSVFALGED